MIQPVFRAQPFARGVSMLERRPVPYLCCYNAKNKLVFKLPIDAVAVYTQEGSSQATLVGHFQLPRESQRNSLKRRKVVLL